MDIPHVTTADKKRKRKRKRCCRWMLAATFRSCFGTCLKKFGHPYGYDSIENSPRLSHSRHSEVSSNGDELQCDNYNLYDSFQSNKSSGYRDFRSRSTGEIYRGGEHDFQRNDFTKPSKRSFSASFNFLNNDGDIFETISENGRHSTHDLRSDVSEAFWSCRGSSNLISGSDQEFYSDDSEEPTRNYANNHTEADHHEMEVCEACGMPGKVHNFDDDDRHRWRDILPHEVKDPPRPTKWIQLS